MLIVCLGRITAAIDSRSWIHALMLDLKWLFAVDSNIKFDISEWYHFVRAEPKRARNMIRKACSSDAARSLTLMETSSAVATLCENHVCHCGRKSPSKPALDAHRGTDHGEIDITRRYCQASNVCLACMVAFSNSKLLSSHLRYGSGYMCLLHCIMFQKPLSDIEVAEIRSVERIEEAKREKLKLPRYLADKTKFRVPGPLWPFFDSGGNLVPESSNLHPFGPKKRKYRTLESDTEDDAGFCLAARYGPCLPCCCLCRGTGLI